MLSSINDERVEMFKVKVFLDHLCGRVLQPLVNLCGGDDSHDIHVIA